MNKYKYLSLFLFLTGTTLSLSAQHHLSATAQRLEQRGYVNVQTMDRSIFVSLMYSRPDNFTGTVLYGDLREAYLHPDAAKALEKAQRRLKQKHPELSLKVYDAARPIGIQQTMWNKVKNTRKWKYVSNPAHGGGLHNYGLAVDVTLCDLKGDTLPMGTRIDHMGRVYVWGRTLRNRRLLAEVMRYGGFTPLKGEWWHFNYCSRPTARKYYKLIK